MDHPADGGGEEVRGEEFSQIPETVIGVFINPRHNHLPFSTGNIGLHLAENETTRPTTGIALLSLKFLLFNGRLDECNDGCAYLLWQRRPEFL